MTAKTNEQAAVNGEKRTERRAKQGPKNVIHVNAKLSCGRCTREWTVENLNPERKVVPCPVCGKPNDIREAVKRAV